MMDYQRLPRRCSSHGSLHGSYRHHRKPGHSLSIRRPLHKPLRAVNENSILLPSPGALESMLKTTTETGDIGMWTIKPIIPSPQRSESFSDISRSLLPSRSENKYSRGHLPCHSQTTAEIQSLYTSGSQRSVNSTLPSSSTGEYGHRSFSMTTCGSRYLPRQASNLTLQTQASSLHLQRPRSPFPYPTRLKRPGVRPASPALTETGLVDYSRMVEIDRISSRTEHGPFRSMNLSFRRRRPPLSLRSEANSSTPTLRNPRGRAEAFSAVSLHPRTISAASIASWNAQHNNFITNRPSRTASFDSICQSHQDAGVEPKLENVVHDAEPKQVPDYYDYTEQFHPSEEHRLHNIDQLKSTEEHSLQSPSTASQDCELNDIFADQASVFSECLSQDLSQSSQEERSQDTRHSTTKVEVNKPSSVITFDVEDQIAQDHGGQGGRQTSNTSVYRVSDIDLLPSQVGRTSIDTFNPHMDVECRPVNLLSYPNYRSVTAPRTRASPVGKPVHVETRTAPTIHSEQGVIFGDQTPEDSQCLAVNDGEESFVSDHIRTASSQKIQMQTAHTISNISLNEAACVTPHRSVANHFKFQDNIAHRMSEQQQSAPYFDMPAESHERSLSASRIRIPRSMTAPGSYHYAEKLPLVTDPSAVERHHQLGLRRHKRREAYVRISDPLPPREEMAEAMMFPPPCSPAPLLEPKPISATRQLKVKNSIPHLMKALPPLPRVQGVVLSTSPALSDDGEYGTILRPFSFVPSNNSAELFGQGQCAQTCADEPRSSPLEFHSGPIKLRLKMTLAASPSLPSIRGSSIDGDELAAPKTHLKKLRLRSSRSSRKTNSQEGSTNRHPLLPIADEFLNGSKPAGEHQAGPAPQSTIGRRSTVQGHEAAARQRTIRGSTGSWKFDPSERDASLQYKASRRVKTRMSGVLRWLNETESDPDRFLTPSNDLSAKDHETIERNIGSAKHNGDCSPKLQVSGMVERHGSLRGLIRTKLVRLVRGAKGVIRKRTRRGLPDM